MNLQQYIEIVKKRHQSGISGEHSYRADLEALIRELVPGVDITNEPNNVTECGNPDYVITKGKIPIGFIEAKDIGKDLNHKQFKEQFDRYRKALDNLIITDYIWFQFFQNGGLVYEVRIAEIVDNSLVALQDNFDEFTRLIQNFCTFVGQTIKSPKKLAEMMAAKARLLEMILEKAIISDEDTAENTALKQQYETFKDILIHDLTPQDFSDIYAQTLAYGMFAARLHDKSLDTFSRQEAAELIPKSNPFLRKLFNHVAGIDIDERIKTTVDNLAEVFRATNVEELLKNFGKGTQTQDPIIHFYETFLAEYDPKLRKSRGVWYTPEPVVKFIVRSVDEILQSEFKLKDGLADTTKTAIKVKTDKPDKRTRSGYVELDKAVHKVQVLDPATGTGTFLAEVVRFIYEKKFNLMQGAWSEYLEEHLIPRLNGFELLMASYSMAHLKLDMLLTETGYQPKKNSRFNIFLTNSLEEHHPDTGTLFSSWLSSEANEANNIKRDTPVMVVMGNPPYSGISINKGNWITDLIDDYKYINGVHFEERKHWLNDDYVKFIRYGQYFIDKNGEGILAYINNHSFLDNPTFRGMRWQLLSSFDAIYVIDLHGNSLKKEVCPDGSIDKNVFDIQAGVSINIFVKTGKKKRGQFARVLHTDFWGSRQDKYNKLVENRIKSIDFKEIQPNSPYYFFIPKNDKGRVLYEKGIQLNVLFPNNTTGIVTMGDGFIVADSKQALENRIIDFIENEYSENDLKQKYKLGKNYAKWIIENKSAIKFNELEFIEFDYRPFDSRWTVFNNKLVWRWRYESMRHFLNGENIGLMSCRQTAINSWEHVGITNLIADDSRISNRTRERGYIFPLYLYPEIEKQQCSDENRERIPNLNSEIVENIARDLSLSFVTDKGGDKGTFAPLDLLDYIYAVLHSPGYRETNKEFLKIDFPRVPYPKDKKTFWQLVKLGGSLRQIHLLDSEITEKYISSYPQDGTNEINRKLNANDWELYDVENQVGRIWINDEQYFDKIPLLAWELYIGGYQPAKKWLKDRKGRKLSYDDILHYQKIIVALAGTDRLMGEIDKIEIE